MEKWKETSLFPTCQLTIIWNLIQEHSEDNYKFSSAEKRALNTSERGAGTPDFKWQGWSKDYFGFEIFDFGICFLEIFMARHGIFLLVKFWSRKFSGFCWDFLGFWFFPIRSYSGVPYPPPPLPSPARHWALNTQTLDNFKSVRKSKRFRFLTDIELQWNLSLIYHNPLAA